MRLTLLATVVALQPQRAALRGAPALALAQHHVQHASSGATRGKLPEQPPLALTATGFSRDGFVVTPPKSIVTTCTLLLCTIMGSVLVACCCHGKLSPSQNTTVRVVGGIASFAAVVYVFSAGIWTRWQMGGELGTSCGLLLLLVVINLVEIALACCCGAVYVTAVVIDKIAHPTVEKMQAHVDAHDLAHHLKDGKFKERSLALFKKSDTDGDGVVDASEMRHALKEHLLPKEVEERLQKDPLILDMFDTNGDHQLNSEEFETLMLYCLTFHPDSPKIAAKAGTPAFKEQPKPKPEAPKPKPEPPKPKPEAPKPKPEPPKPKPEPPKPKPEAPKPAPAQAVPAPKPEEPKPTGTPRDSNPGTPRDDRRRRQQEDMRRREEERKRLGSD